MYRLSIGAIAKNEHFGLREWAAYHRLVGVEHIYIYDNDSQIPVRETLAKEIAEGYVTCTEFPGLSQQMPAYNDCLARYGANNVWIAFIDCDEFMVPKKTNSVVDVLGDYTNYASLQVNWVLFGSGGHIKHPEGLVVESYTKSTPFHYKENLHTKAIIQPSKVQRAGNNPHYFVPKHGFYNVGENFEEVPNAWSKRHSVEKIQLNHYSIKSLDDFKAKISKGRADAAHLPTASIESFHMTDGWCTEKDASIQRFVQPLKQSLEIV